MKRCLLGVVVLAMIWGWGAWAAAPALSGSLGVEVTFTVPLLPLEVESAITLALTFGRAEVISRTELSLAGIVEQHLTMGVKLAGVGLRTGMRFDPCFSRYWFAVRGWVCPWELGGWFLVENLEPACQTPSYTIGIVLDLGIAWRPGFFGRSLTGFGVTGLAFLVDDDPATELVAVPGVWFEEQLIHLGFTSAWFQADSLVLFDEFGLAWFEVGAAYLYPDPAAELGVRFRLDGAFALERARLFLGVRVPPVAIRLTTTFDLFGFVSQTVWAEVAFSWVRIYSRTEFDFVGLVESAVGIEVKF